MKTILVTGSNGLLGQKISAVHALKPKSRLVATSRGPDRFKAGNTYIYEELDLLDPQRVETVLGLYRPDVVIHTAAVTNADTCAEQPELCDRMNIEAVAQLVQLCARKGIHLVYLSTDFVFDGQSGPYRESDQPNPLSHYGGSKLAAEKLVSAMQGPWTVVRTVLVYGVLRDMSRSNLVLWAKESLEAGRNIRVVNDQWRTPTLAEDLAAACLEIAERGLQGIYHISGEEFISIAQMVRRVAQFWSLDEGLITEVPSSVFVQPAKRPMRTGFIVDKAAADFGYRPHRLEEGLAVVARQLSEMGIPNLSA
ncbi:NAD(P)-dependent oxidoreductase [Pedobacter yulinensis]|uniref:dTDP-4-dehydrorhamnose reductase n=1 Tax=Pedobacter yulinensis TaxID=2126353 RepID=A0A2T3HHH0_9SPHI|nr:SDR family oxidoreductase [Pedobacter yulinensis]PST81880.1 NAD(P)-dependent oxidoreductase [Pedobacter yulinensis]